MTSSLLVNATEIKLGLDPTFVKAGHKNNKKYFAVDSVLLSD